MNTSFQRFEILRVNGPIPTNSKMRVRTTQGYDLREFAGPINLDLGSYRDNPTIKAAQRKLYDKLIEEGKLSDDQVVWGVQNNSSLRVEVGQYLHVIDVDTRDIVAYIDSLVWCHILDYGPRYIPPDDLQSLRRQAAINGGDCATALRTLEDNFLDANLSADLWSAVSKDIIDKTSDQVLLRFPFKYSAIVNVSIVSENSI